MATQQTLASVKNPANGQFLTVQNLRVDTDSGEEIVSQVGFSTAAGEVLAIVGESGCGKTSIAMALLGHARRGTKITCGSVVIDGLDLLSLSPSELRRARKTTVSYVPQDPQKSLSPLRRIGRQLREALSPVATSILDPATRISEILARVDLPTSPEFLRKYPFQLSGGQQQRVLIAMALLCSPRVVVLDEPTTGLDVVTQASVLELLGQVAKEEAVAFIYITHDLAVVERVADRIAVIYAGRLVELGSKDHILQQPRHPYSAMLIGSVPRIRTRLELTVIPGLAPPPGNRPSGCRFRLRCPCSDQTCADVDPPIERLATGRAVACHHQLGGRQDARPISVPPEVRRRQSVLEVVGLNASHGRGDSRMPIVKDVSFAVGAGECVALVGESGSGKTTTGRCLAGLHPSDAGIIRLHGEPLAVRVEDRTQLQRSTLQTIFQNPSSSLNPSHTVETILKRALKSFGGGSRGELGPKVFELLDRVHLSAALHAKFPGELSGGEQQRVAIARSLASDPEVIICDEITSALDVSIQAAILRLMRDLLTDGIGLLFITHNLGVVNSLAHRILVMRDGCIVEAGQTSDVIASPHDAYTRVLMNAAPDLGANDLK